MLVDLEDGRCPTCNGQLEITDVDDCSLTATCTECDETIRVEPDAFNDGGIKYWPVAMAELDGDL